LRLSDIATKTNPVSVTAPGSDQEKEVTPLTGLEGIGHKHHRSVTIRLASNLASKACLSERRKDVACDLFDLWISLS
jgi:hypothetical protein